MEETDHGELLTKFEDTFGSLVEHEVIKMVLQSCGWNSSSASVMILSMIDLNQLPPHIRTAVTAEAVVRGACISNTCLLPSPAGLHNGMLDVSEDSDDNERSVPTEIQKVLRSVERSGSESPDFSVPSEMSIKQVNSSSCRPHSHSSTLTPFAMAQGTIAKEPFLSKDFHLRPLSSINANSLMCQDEEKEIVDILPPDVDNLSDKESDTSLPHSPLKASAPELNFETTRACDTSQWVLAPEFVPNALHRTGLGLKTGHNPSLLLGPNSNGGLWPFGPINQEATLPSNSRLTVKSKWSKKDEVINKILLGEKMMVLMRGLPGSGKTTLAKEVKGHTGVILSTDDFFCDKQGRYIYEPSRISEAHAWNKNRARLKLREKRSPIIIDNTNLQFWEMKPYVKLSLQNGYEVDILEPETHWKLSTKELAKRNIHAVPKEKIKEMKERYDPSIKIEHVIAAVGNVDLELKETNGVGLKQNHNQGRTEWPTTLPETKDNGNATTIHGKESETDRNGFLHDNSIPSTTETPQNVSSGMNSQKPDTSSNSLSYLEAYGGVDSGDDDDADVVIEGYEDLQESDCGADATEKIKGMDETSCMGSSTKDSGDLNANIPYKDNGTEEESPQISRDATEEVLDEANEEVLRMLLEEANLEVGDEHDEEWDDLVMRVSGDELNEEKFNELVGDLGTSVKCELEKKQQGNHGNKACIEDVGGFAEDSAMYDFCSNMEDKIGRPLSSIVTDEVSSLFSVINAARLDGSPAQDLHSDDVIKTEPSRIPVLSDKKDSVISSVIEGLICDSTKSMAGDSPGISCNDLSAVSNIEVNHTDSNSSIEPRELNRASVKLGNEFDTGKGVDEMVVSDDTKKSDSSDHHNHVGISHELLKSKLSSEVCPSSLPLTSWECMDIKEAESSSDWDSSTKDDVNEIDMNLPKQTRESRRRTSGNPQKWMFTEEENKAVDTNACSWEPLEEGAGASWEDTKQVKDKNKFVSGSKPQSHTGAVPKFRKTDIHHSSSMTSMSTFEDSSPKISEKKRSLLPALSKSSTVDSMRCSDLAALKQKVDGETQTLSIDFQALVMDNNLYELKILYGQPDYIPEYGSEGMQLDDGPLTKGRLYLEKGTMTENPSDVVMVKPLQNLIAFFPKIPEPDLRDFFEKCKYDLDWTMNVLLDSGYEMAESVVDRSSQEGSDLGIDLGTEELDTSTNVETNSTGEDLYDRLTLANSMDIDMDPISEEKTRKMKQSKQPGDLVYKKKIESAFTFAESVDDRVTRLTGKDFDNLNLNKVKQKKAKKKHSKKKHSEGNVSKENNIQWEEGEGAQYITLAMDSLFASQLVSLFGPIGSCGMSGEMALEDRSVILPLELCHQIHKYWTKTLDGKFNHEDEVLDNLIKEDENLARYLQEEEERSSKNAGLGANSSSLENSEQIFQLDPPTNFKEIMDLEQALLESQGNKNVINEASLSSHLSLQRLYAEYPHVDRDALKQEFLESGFNYQDTVKRISNRYGCEQGAPKTVIAPELLHQYEQQMIQKAKQLSLEQQQLEETEHHQEEEDLQPDNPQVYRDEAQTHYNQRQEYYRKAQEAYRQGMKAVAAYYAGIGKLHSEKLNEANQRASLKILEAVNAKRDASVLDLHLLHVPEALSATSAFLAEREQVLTAININQMQVSLITGRGAHSSGGQARLKPAIKDYLLKKGYLFHEANSGMFVITLQK